MTELEQYGLIEELDEFSEWMRDSAPEYDVEVYQSLEEQIKDLEHESGDFYATSCEKAHLFRGGMIAGCQS